MRVKALGIDFGTRYTRAAIVRDGRVEVLQHADAGADLPSLVSYTGRMPVIGGGTLARAIASPESTVPLLKLLLGRTRSPAVTAIASRVGFSIRASETGLLLGVGGAERTPEAVVTALLEWVYASSLDRLGARPDRVAISTSAWMEDEARRALANAAKRAGMEDAELVGDTTAALLAHPRRATERIAVIDAGAGGTSAALYAVGADRIELVASASTEAGGEAADELLSLWAWRELAKHGPVSRDVSTREMTRQAVERAKRTLSIEPTATVPLPLDRAGLEPILAPVLVRIEDVCRRALDASGARPTEIDRVLLLGGMGELACVVARVERVFERHRPIEHLRAHEVVRGTAHLAAMRAGVFPPVSIRERPGPWPAIAPSAGAAATIAPARAGHDATPVRASTSAGAATEDLAHVPPGTGDLQFALTHGRFENPQTAHQLLSLPLVGRLGGRDLERVALPVLLFSIIARQKKTGTLTLAAGDKSAIVPVVRGTAWLKRQELAALGQAFRWPVGTWVFDPEPPETPPIRARHAVIRLVTEGLRSVARTFGDDELRQALADRMSLAPAVPADLSPDLERLGLLSNEARIARTFFDGTRSLADLASRVGASVHTTLLVAALLLLFDYLDWTAPKVKAPRSVADDTEARARELEATSNHFDVLGLHWSATPGEIARAYEVILRSVSPGTPAHAHAPAACARIITRARAAHAVLKDDASRLAYRSDTYPDVDFGAVTDILGHALESQSLRGDQRAAERTKTAIDEVERASHHEPPTPSEPPRKR